MIMGDRTYDKMYADNMTMTTARATPSFLSVEGALSAEKSIHSTKDPRTSDVLPPPYQNEAMKDTDAQHPALQHSPNYTDSSINTASTRRISVDARRRSVSSRRMSMAGAAIDPSVLQQASVHDGTEEDLLAESPAAAGVKGIDVLAGLKNQLQSVERNSPQIGLYGRRSLPLVPEEQEIPGDLTDISFKSPNAAGAHMMSKSPPPSATSGRRQSVAGGRRMSTFSRDGTGPLKSTPNASVTKSGMRTPVRSNAIVPVGGNPGSTAPPGSAIAARYPGSAVATGRLSQGFTPSRLPAITFQDFAKLVEVQFLDNLRRGASINYADLQPNPVPSNLRESYILLCITSPNVAELETAIHTLQMETSRLRSSASDLEVMLGQTNPAIFRHVQTASYEQLEALRNNVAALKKACRAKATALLKDVRCQMEESKFGRLARAVDALKADLAWAQEVSRHIDGVSRAAETFSKEKRQEMMAKKARLEEVKDLRKRLESARAVVQERRAANSTREEKLEASKKSVMSMQEEYQQIMKEKARVQAEIEEVKQSLSRSSLIASHDGANAREVLERMRTVSLYEKCGGMKLISCSAKHGQLRCTLRVADIFAVELLSSETGLTVAVQQATNNTKKPSYHDMAMKFIIDKEKLSFSLDKDAAICAVQNLVCQLNRAATAAKEMHCIRAECSHICQMIPIPAFSSSASRAEMRLQLGFVGLKAGIRFTVDVSIMSLNCNNVEVVFGGDHMLDKSQIFSTIQNSYKTTDSSAQGLKAICMALSRMITTMETSVSHSSRLAAPMLATS